MHLNTLLVQADSLRFKLLGFIGRDEGKKTKIVDYLAASGWIIIDVESELLALRAKLDAGGIDNVFELVPKLRNGLTPGLRIWFSPMPASSITTCSLRFLRWGPSNTTRAINIA